MRTFLETGREVPMEGYVSAPNNVFVTFRKVVEKRAESYVRSVVDHRSRDELMAEALKIEAHIQELRWAKDTLEKHGVPFTARQEAVLEWYENQLLEIEILVTQDDESFDEEDPHHGSILLGVLDWIDHKKRHTH
jgi:hypothetical protein